MTVFAFPEFLIVSLGVLAVAVYLLHRWAGWAAAAAALYCGAIAVWLWRLPGDAGLQRLAGLPFAVDMQGAVQRHSFRLQIVAANEPVVVMTLLAVAVALLLTVPITNPGRWFPSFALALGAGYAALAMLVAAPLEPVLLTPVFLSMLAAVSVFALQAGRLGDALGPLRSLLAPIFAIPFFLIAAWYIDRIPLNPQDTSATVYAARLLAVGLLLLLAPVPLHSAQPAISESAPPLVAALSLLLYQLAVLALLFRTVTLYPFVASDSPLNLWLTGAGVLTAVWGGLAAAGAGHPGRLWGYAMLHDWGLILLMLAVPGERSWPLVVLLFGLRAASMLAAAAGLAQLRRAVGQFGRVRFHGVGTRLPWNTTAFLLGSLGFAGFPLSAGFTGHWAALQTVAETDWRVAAVVLLASGGVVFGFIRMVRIFFGPLENRMLSHERPLSVAVAVIAIVVVAGMAVAPQLLDRPIAWAIFAFTG